VIAKHLKLRSQILQIHSAQHFKLGNTSGEFSIMATLINTVDALLSIADLIDIITQFTQQKAIRKAVVVSRSILKALIRLIGWLAIVLIYWSIIGIQAIYRNWKTTLPVAIAAFQTGYAGVEPANIVTPVVTTLPVPPSPSRTQQLRQACTQAGIPWRNAKGRSKHLSIREMEAALSQ
jgi:hypothetical protein